MNGRVFLIQEPGTGRDITTATQYGTIVQIFAAEESPGLRSESGLRRLAEALQSYDPAHDHICYAGGDWATMYLTGAVMQELGFETVSYLRWERGRGDQPGTYRPVTINHGKFTRWMDEQDRVTAALLPAE